MKRLNAKLYRLASVLARRTAACRLKVSVKGGNGRIAYFLGNGADRRSRVAQKRAGGCDPGVMDVFHRTHFKCGLEPFAKRRIMNEQEIAERADGNGFVKMLGNVLQYGFKILHNLLLAHHFRRRVLCDGSLIKERRT